MLAEITQLYKAIDYAVLVYRQFLLLQKCRIATLVPQCALFGWFVDDTRVMMTDITVHK